MKKKIAVIVVAVVLCVAAAVFAVPKISFYACEPTVYFDVEYCDKVDAKMSAEDAENSDSPVIGENLALHDPRNYNLKKHMIRLAVYELTKLIAPNNVSVVRMRDYEDSMKWLNDASKLRINPQIPRKIAEDNKPVTDWQMATFQTSYDPYKNPWQI